MKTLTIVTKVYFFKTETTKRDKKIRVRVNKCETRIIKGKKDDKVEFKREEKIKKFHLLIQKLNFRKK